MKRTPLTDGLVGTLYEPEDPHGVLLVLGGSSGGVPDELGERLAATGVVTAALAYFGAPALPDRLLEIPLDYVERGLQLLATHPAAGGRVSVFGVSKGAELALLCATRFPALVGRVAAATPSCAAWYGLDNDRPDQPPSGTRSSWTHKGEPVPFVAGVPGAMPTFSAAGMAIRPAFDAPLAAVSEDDPGLLPIEQATGPILLVSGGDDQMWPATEMSERLVARLAAHGRAGDVRHLAYPDAGHMVLTQRPPGMPTRLDFGGTPAADAAASAEAWVEIAAFLGAATPAN